MENVFQLGEGDENILMRTQIFRFSSSIHRRIFYSQWDSFEIVKFHLGAPMGENISISIQYVFKIEFDN
jgi:hypothetical protein